MSRFDAEELAGVRPQDAAGYLRATGWQATTSYGTASVWAQEAEGARVEVLLPTTAQIDDYPARIADLLRTLAAVERRSRKEILYELRFPMLDLQHITTTPPTPSGTTFLHHGYLAAKGVHDLFLTAATSVAVRDPQPVMPKSKPKEARNFLELVRFGSSGRGSYVLRVETVLNVPARLVQVVPPRTVLLHLYEAVHAARNAAEEVSRTRDIRAFEQQIGHGVSANLCEALADIGSPDNLPFDFQFTWAKPRPVEQPTPDITFGADHAAILRRAGKHLRGLVRTDFATIQGAVVELRRRSRRTLGRAIIEGELNIAGQTTPAQRFAVTLPDQLYDLALQAHRTERLVLISGTLITSGRRPELVDVGEFRVS